MSFTMHYTAYPERKTRFTKMVEGSGRIHALIDKGKPWRNGFIERSNRTDKEELFNQLRFRNSEERRYQLKLWEMEYNYHRPHQGLNNQIPFDVYRHDYPFHAASRCTT
jgi:transposase InsO family protein